jgi:hypothetical protein
LNKVLLITDRLNKNVDEPVSLAFSPPFGVLYESRQPSAVSTQQKAFIFCCARQGMGVYMKVLSVK